MNKYSNPEEYGYLKIQNNRELVAGVLEEIGLKVYDLTKKFLLSIGKNPENLYVNMHPGMNSATAIMYFDGIFLQEEFLGLLFEDDVERYKRGFLMKEEDIHNHYKNGEFDSVLMQCGQKLKPLIFNLCFDNMSDKDKFINFINMYKECDYSFSKITSKTLKDVFKLIPNEIVRKRKDSKLIDDEGYIQIYRGMISESKKANKAMSWTTDIEMAKWFGSRFGKKGKVVSGKVHMDDVLFIFQEECWYLYPDEEYDDNENEIMVMPGKVRNIEDIE